MNPHHLLDQARHLARRQRGRPRQTDLCRAVSAAYYALFHGLCEDCVGLLLFGPARPGWNLAYRAVQHSDAKRACAALLHRLGAPLPLRGFAEAFVTLQQERHQADYDPNPGFTRSKALSLVDLAEDARRAYLSVDQDSRRQLLAEIVFRKRP